MGAANDLDIKLNTRRDIASSQTAIHTHINIYMVYLVKQVNAFFWLLNKHTNDDVFDNLPKISDHFRKILQKLSKSHTDISENFLNISEDYRGFMKDELKIAKDIRERSEDVSIIHQQTMNKIKK